jgi:hypothetical protein
MSTPISTPVFAAPQPEIAAAPAPARKGRRILTSVVVGAVTLAVSIGVGALVDSQHNKKAMDNFVTDVRDEPGIKSVRDVAAPAGYERKLDINNGAASVTFKREGERFVMTAELSPLADPSVQAGIAHAADEAGFDDKS